MVYTRDDILKVLKTNTCFGRFDEIMYELKIWSSVSAISELYTCIERPEGSGNRIKIIEQADIVLSSSIDYFGHETLHLVNMVNDYPLFIPVLSHRYLKQIWPDKYPSNSNIPDDALIVEDGNKRLTALAIRYKQRKPIAEKVGIFIGHVPTKNE